MSSVTVTKIVAAPVERVWEAFTNLRTDTGSFGVGTTWRETRVSRSGRSTTEDLVVLEVDPRRSCTIGLAGSAPTPRLTYRFTPAGPSATAVNVFVESGIGQGRLERLGNQFLAVMATFAARAAEGALRDELESLAERAGATPAWTRRAA